MSRTPSRLWLAILFLSISLGCGDAAPPTVPGRLAPPASPPRHSVTAADAFTTADSYDERDPLAAFGVSEWDFNENPELITDEQFIQQGESTLADWELPGIESDAYNIEYHADTCSGQHTYSGGAGGGGGEADYSVLTFSYDRCDDLYKSCTNRCRRIRNPKGRGACWVTCMAAYAICRANR